MRCLIALVVLTCALAKPPPNIVMIVADDYGFGDVSFHGSQQIPTPNIDYLANNGIILDNNYVLPICSPTRSAIMTGRYPIYTGMNEGTVNAPSPWGVGLDEKFLPQYMQELGYSTHAFGKWHLGFFEKEYTPTFRGFDTFYGYYTGAGDYWDHSQWDTYWGLDLHHDINGSSKVVYNQWGNYSSFMYTQEAIGKINEHRDGDKPMFLYLAYQAVHDANLVQDALQAPLGWLNKFSHIKHEGRRKYAAMVGAMDENIGRLYNTLKSKGLLDNTVIVFTSDNGGPPNGLDQNWASNFPLRGAKTTLWEGGVRAASCIYSHLLSTTGIVSHDLMHVTDWLPTFIGIAGGMAPAYNNLSGFDMWPTLRDGVASPRKEILLNIDENMFQNAALRQGDWKLIKQGNFYDGWYPPPGSNNEATHHRLKNSAVDCGAKPAQTAKCGAEMCLFNIQLDPCEYTDLSKQFPEIYESMAMRLQEYYREMAVPRRTTFVDPQANPKLHNGAWVPWRSRD